MDVCNIEELDGVVVVDVTVQNKAQLSPGGGVAFHVYRHVQPVTSSNSHQQLVVNPCVVFTW